MILEPRSPKTPRPSPPFNPPFSPRVLFPLRNRISPPETCARLTAWAFVVRQLPPGSRFGPLFQKNTADPRQARFFFFRSSPIGPLPGRKNAKAFRPCQTSAPIHRALVRSMWFSRPPAKRNGARLAGGVGDRVARAYRSSLCCPRPFLVAGHGSPTPPSQPRLLGQPGPPFPARPPPGGPLGEAVSTFPPALMSRFHPADLHGKATASPGPLFRCHQFQASLTAGTPFPWAERAAGVLTAQLHGAVPVSGFFPTLPFPSAREIALAGFPSGRCPA